MTSGLIVAEAVMMGLAPHLGRNEAHDVVYAACRIVNEQGGTLADVLAGMPEVSSRLDRARDRTADRPGATISGWRPQMVDRVLASSAACGRRRAEPDPDSSQSIPKERTMFAGIARVATILSLAISGERRAFAQDYPTKPVAMVMPFSAGGPGDNLARVLGQSMTKSLGQTVIIENTAGAGGTIGTDQGRQGPAGRLHAALHAHQPRDESHALPQAALRHVKDFEPIGLVAEVPMTLVAKKDLAPNNFKELLAYLQGEQGQGVVLARRDRVGLAPVRASAPDRHPDQCDHRAATREPARR